MSMESSSLEAMGMEMAREEEVVMSMGMTDPHHQLSEQLLEPNLDEWMREANGIIERFKIRGNRLPRFFYSNSANRTHLSEEHAQEHSDASKLHDWKQIVDNKTVCPQEIQIFLDSHMPQWRDVGHIEKICDDTESHEGRMREAHEIVQRYKNRGGVLPLPRHCKEASDSPDAILEDKDATKLYEWKNEIEKLQSSSLETMDNRPSDNFLREYADLRDYLDQELQAWRDNSQTWSTNAITNSEGDISTHSELEIARGIYNRYVSRGYQMPEQVRNARGDVEKKQEAMDAMKLHKWKQSLLGGTQKDPQNPQYQCPEDVVNFLDEHMPQWREKAEKQSYQKALVFAQGIVERYVARGNVMPVRSKECKADPMRAQEYRDGAKLNDWKLSLRGKKTKTVCCEEVREYLDEKLPMWREVVKETHNDPMGKAMEIVQRYRERNNVMPREWRQRHNDPVRAQEYKDASKLRNWKRALKGNGTHNCPDEVRDYLDQEMPDWRKDVRKQYTSPMVTAREIVERYNLRGKVLPRHFSSNRKDPDRQQEYKDAKKLYDWKQGLKGLRFYRCSPELKEYLDANLPGWNDGVYSKASLLAEREASKVSAEGGGAGNEARVAVGGDKKIEARIEEEEEGGSKVVSVSVPSVSLGLAAAGDGVDANGGLVERAKKRLRDEEDREALQHHHQHQLLQQQHHQQQHQQLHHDGMMTGETLHQQHEIQHQHEQHQQQQQYLQQQRQQQQYLEQQQLQQQNQEEHLLLPPAKIPRGMEMKEV